MRHRNKTKYVSKAGHTKYALPVPDYVCDEFLEMISSCQLIIMHVCLLNTDRKPDSIRDLYQEILRTLWEAWPSFRGESSISTWVYRIAFNVAIDERHSKDKSPQFVPLEEWMYDTISEEIEKAPPDYYNIISALNPDERALIYLRLDGLSIREIAEALDTSEDVIKQRLHRLRQKINTIKQQQYED